MKSYFYSDTIIYGSYFRDNDKMILNKSLNMYTNVIDLFYW